jgi:hypothetical protein
VEDARTWLGDPALERIFLPRGMRDAGLASFLAAAKREGVDVQLLGVMGADTAPGRTVQGTEG